MNMKKKILMLSLGGGRVTRATEKVLKEFNTDEEITLDKITFNLPEFDQFPENVQQELLTISNTLKGRDRRERLIETLLEYGLFSGNEEYVYHYDKAVYHCSAGEIETRMVGEALIRMYDPDMIYVIGTPTSCWLDFYLNFASRKLTEIDIDFIREFQCIEKEGSKPMTLPQLRRFQKRIAGMFPDDWSDRLPGIHPVLVRKGLEDKELRENYRILSGIWNSKEFDRDTEYDVAFDITHSFRTLPICNLSVINYLSITSKYKINLSHIYYGNLAGAHSTVTDIHDILRIFSLAGAATEFKDSGNTNGILKLAKKRDRKLAEALQKFDIAVQTSNLNDSTDSLVSLLEQTGKKNRSSVSYNDLRKMIHEVLQDGLLNESAEDFERLYLELDEHPENIAFIQYMFSKWYFTNSRYGQALVSAEETLKTYLSMFMHRKWGKILTKEMVTNEASRKSAIQALSVIEGLEENRTNAAKLIKQISYLYTKLHQIRNIFAHNLYRETDVDNAELIGLLESMFDVLKALNDLWKCGESNAVCGKVRLEDLDGLWYIKSDESKTGSCKNKPVVIVTPSLIRGKRVEKAVDFSGLCKDLNGKKHDVFMLPRTFQEVITGEAGAISNKIVFLGEVLAEYLFMRFEEDLTIVMAGLTDFQMLVFTLPLKEKGFNRFKRVEFPDNIKSSDKVSVGWIKNTKKLDPPTFVNLTYNDTHMSYVELLKATGINPTKDKLIRITPPEIPDTSKSPAAKKQKQSKKK